MKRRNLANRQYRPVPPPPDIFAKPPARDQPEKVSIRDFLPPSDLDRLTPHLAPIKKLGSMETDRDGLLNLGATGLNIVVSPELLVRAIEACDAVLKGAGDQGWPITKEENGLRITVFDELLEIEVTEKVDPVPGVHVRPGDRRPRRPTGVLVVALKAGYQKAMVSDKRGTKIESKLPDLFSKAETLAAEVHAERQTFAAMERERQLASRRRIELELQVGGLDKNVAAWERAERIRAYVQAVEKRMTPQAPIEPGSHEVRWLEWARQYADRIDPTCGPIVVAPQEFWE